jgi:hypothetical protein
MAKKSLTPWVLACLALTGPAVVLAGSEPLPPQAAPHQTAAAELTVGVDKNGRLRQPTAEELQQLDARQTKRAAAATGKSAVAGRSLLNAPRSEKEAMTTLKTAPSGMRSMAVPEDLMSSLTVTRGADGALVISEGNGTDHGRPAEGAAHE